MEGILNAFTKTIFKPRQREKIQAQSTDTSQDIINDINSLKIQIAAAKLAFEMETDFDLIDSYVMQIDSLEKKYSYLIKKAKANHVVAFSITK